MRTPQIGPPKVSGFQAGISDLGAHQDGILEVGPSKVGSMEVGSGKINPFQRLPTQLNPAETSAFANVARVQSLLPVGVDALAFEVPEAPSPRLCHIGVASTKPPLHNPITLAELKSYT